jgi:tyrosinase
VHDAVLANHRRAEVRLHAIRQPEQSALVRVFLNDTGAGHTTSIDDDHYAGHFTLFGHGPCIGGPGHCEARPTPRRRFDTRVPHHNEPWNVRFDVTDTVRKLKAKGESDLQVTLVPLSPDGNDAALRMKGISLAFHD